MDCSPFKRLPAELRNDIYDLSVSAEHGGSFNVFKSEPALLRTCRQIRQEASSVFYSSNTFHVTVYDNVTTGLVRWLQVKPKTTLKHVRTFNITSVSDKINEFSILQEWESRSIVYSFFRSVERSCFGRWREQAWQAVLDALYEANMLDATCSNFFRHSAGYEEPIDGNDDSILVLRQKELARVRERQYEIWFHMGIQRMITGMCLKEFQELERDAERLGVEVPKFLFERAKALKERSAWLEVWRGGCV